MTFDEGVIKVAPHLDDSSLHRVLESLPRRVQPSSARRRPPRRRSVSNSGRAGGAGLFGRGGGNAVRHHFVGLGENAARLLVCGALPAPITEGNTPRSTLPGQISQAASIIMDSKSQTLNPTPTSSLSDAMRLRGFPPPPPAAGSRRCSGGGLGGAGGSAAMRRAAASPMARARARFCSVSTFFCSSPRTWGG